MTFPCTSSSTATGCPCWRDLAGRQDDWVGLRRRLAPGTWHLAPGTWHDHYPRATLAVLDRAGHALAHEQRGLLAALVDEWLDRVAEAQAG